MANTFDGYSDEELESIASGKAPTSASPDNTDFSSYTDDELAKLAGTLSATEQPSDRSFVDRLPDPLIAGVKGAVGLIQGSLGIQDLMSFGLAGKTAEAMGIRTKDAQKELDELLSPQQKEANKKVADAQGFFNTIGAAFANPSVISQTVIESLPSMIEGAGIGRGLMKFFPKLAPVIAGAIGEGTVTAGSMAEDIRADSESGFLTPAQVGLSTVAGGLTGLLGVLGGKLAKRLGFLDPDTLLVGGINSASKDVRQEAQKKIFRSVLESAISEGAWEELPQSALEQMMQNLATGKPMTEGVAEAGAMGMLAGMVMGGGGGAGGHVLAGLEILKQDSEDTATATQIQNFASSENLAKLPNIDLLQSYHDGIKFQESTPDDIDVTAALDTMKTELEKRGIWPEDKLSTDIELKMAELDAKLGGTVKEGSDLVRETERTVEDQTVAEPIKPIQPIQGTLPLTQMGEDIKSEIPKADASENIASSPSSFFSMPEIGTQEVKEEKTPSTLPLTELSEEGMANPPSTSEKTPSAQNTGSLVAKKGSEFGLKGNNVNRWTVDGNVMGNTPEEAVAEYDKQKQMAEDDAKQKETFDKVIPKLISGDYTEDDIKGITTFGKTTTTARQMDGILTSLGLTHKQAGQARKKAGDVDTTSKGAVLYDVGRTVETARAMGLLGKKKADVPKAQTVTEPLEKGLPVKEPKIKSSDMKTIKEVFGADNLEGIKTIYDDIVEMYPYASFHRHGNIVTKTIGASKEKDNFFYVLTPEGDIHLVNTYGGFPAKQAEVEKQWGKEEASKSPQYSSEQKPDVPSESEKTSKAVTETKKTPTVKKSLTVQKELTLESYARKHKINFNIPGHTNKEAISDGLLSYTKNDAVGLDKFAEEAQGLGLLGATPDEYATAGDYLYAELQKIVYNRINKKTQSLTAEEDQAIKEMKEALKKDGYDESGIEREASESDRTGKKEAYSIKDSETDGEAQSLLEEDDIFVKEEEAPTDYRTIAKKVDAFADGSYTPEDLKEIVDNQTKLDELDSQVPVGTTIRIKTGFGESILHKSSKKEGTYQISRFDTKGEAIGDSEYTNYEKAVKDLRHEQGSAVKAVDTLLPIIEKAKTQPETKAPSKELFDTSSMFTLSGNQPVEQKSMKVPEKKGERLLDVKKQTTDELKDRLSGEKAKREFEEGKKTGEAKLKVKSKEGLSLQKGKTLDNEGMELHYQVHIAAEYGYDTDGEFKLLKHKVYSDTYGFNLESDSLQGLKDKMTEFKNTEQSLKVGTVEKGSLLSPEESQALVSDILSILADGSTINFVGKIDPNRPDIQKALAQWKQGNPGASFVIEGMHRKVVVDGNKMAALIEIAMKGSSDIKLTAWHEAWHSIDELFLTENEQKILAEKLTPDIEKQANIFAKYAANQKHLLPNSAKPIFERIRTFFEKLGNYLKGRGFTSAEDVFDRALRGELKQRTARWTGEGDSALQISAKHGSPFVFDRFTTDRIGSGEGAQMFGWGLYFTDKEDVAKYYAENLGKGELKIQGRTWSQASDTFKLIISTWLKSGNFDYVKNMVNQSIENVEKLPNSLFAHDLDVLTEIKREIDKGEQSFYDNVKYKESSRNLYNVTLHKGKDPSEYNYMDWEKSIGSKVGTVIRNGLPEDFIEDCEDRWNAPVEEWNGREAYDAIVRYAMEDALPGDTSMGGNPEKEASLFLLRNGIDGIKYPTGTISGGNNDGFNYVVFDENAVTIEDRVSFKIKVAPFIKNLISSNSKKAVNPETSFKDGKDDFKRQFKEVLGKDYSNWKAHFYLPFFKGHGPNAEPMWKRAFDNTEAGREKRSELNSHYVRKMHDFLDMPKEKTRNIEKVLSEGDAVLAQQIRDLIAESVTAKNGGNLELAKELREKAQAIKDLNRYSDEELAEGITLRTGEVVRLTPQEAKVYTDVRTAFDEMHRDQFKHQIEMVFGKHRDKAWYSSMIDLFEDRPDSPEFGSDKRNTLKALNKLALGKIRGKKAETIQKNRDALMEVLKSHISTVSGITDQTELNGLAGDMLKAYKTEKVLMNAIKKARNRIGQQVAYFPRVRERGNVYANIFKTEKKTDKNGEEKVFKTMIHSQVVKNAEEARQLWEQYKSDPSRKNDDLSYELGAVNKESDSTYVGVNDMNLQRVIDNAIERIRNTRNLDSGPLLDSLKTSMVQAVANEMKSRGFGKSSITRRLNLIEGYKKTDLQKVALDYITGMTGMMTKQETAMNFHDILKDIPRDKPKLYNDIGKYAQDMLRNQNGLDRASGKARGITFIYYLGGNLKSALVQLTQNHVTAIPKLAEKMREWGVKGIAEAKYHKAMADAARIKVNEKTGEVKGKSINQWESRLLTDFLHRGNTADQYMQYITGRMQNELGQKFGAVMNVLSKPFGKMETFNRESASLAMFRMAWNYYTETIPDLEERYAKAYEEAKEYVNFTHFAYGKENLPRIATGGDLASVSARTLLTFRSFNHNYIQSIFGSKDWKTMAHSLAYVALFGGMMGLPFIKDLSDLLEKLTGKSYTKSAREVMRKFGGKTLETFGVQGLPALAGANISGSMAIGIPLVGETATDTVTGVMGGMFDKAKKGVRFAAKGQAYKAAESLLPEMVANPMKALRMSDVGKEYLGTPGYATTSSGKPVFDENGKPLKMSMTDMALKTIGINPAEYSMRTEAQRSASNIEEYFSDWKTNIYEEYRAGASTHDAKAISKALRQIREYNQAIIDKGAMGLISRIKMSNVVKASKIEMTKKQKREAQYKKNYLDT